MNTPRLRRGGGDSFLFIYFIFYLYQVLVFPYSIPGILFVTQLPSLERWALLPFWGFPTPTCFLFFLTSIKNLYHIFLASVGLSLGLFYFIVTFLYLILG